MTLETQQTQNWADACLRAVRATTECVDWCVQNPDGKEDCIRLCLDAGDLCTAAARLIVRESRHARAMLEVTADVAQRCAEACRDHRDEHAVLARCAGACQDAAEACRAVADRQD